MGCVENFETPNKSHPFAAIARTGRDSRLYVCSSLLKGHSDPPFSLRPRKTSAHNQYGGRPERVEFRECGAEDHWEGVEPPLPKFRSHQDWIMRVQLALCRICVAVPALFGRGSPFREGGGKSEPHSGVPSQVPTTSLLCSGRSETREDACAGILNETAQPEI